MFSKSFYVSNLNLCIKLFCLICLINLQTFKTTLNGFCFHTKYLEETLKNKEYTNFGLFAIIVQVRLWLLVYLYLIKQPIF